MVKGSQLKENDIVLVKRVAWKGRHKIQNKWDPNEYIIVETAPILRFQCTK